MYNKLLLLLLLFFISPFAISCAAQNEEEEEDDSMLLASERWKTTLQYSGLIGTPCEENQEIWMTKNPNLMWGLTDMGSQTIDIDKNGKIDVALFYITPEKCLQGTPWETGSDHGLLVFDDPEGIYDLITISNITYIIDDKVKFKMEDLGLGQILKTKINYQKMEGPFIHGFYEAWLTTDAGCCPSYSGSFAYDFNLLNIELKNRKN